MSTDQELSEKTLEAIREFVPKLKVISKEKSWFHRAIGAVLKWFGNSSYMDNYYTTIGYTVALPRGMSFLPWYTSWHEGGHGLQARKLTRPLFSTLYLQGTPVWLVAALLTCWPFFVWLPWWSGVAFLAFFALLSFPPFGFYRAHWEFQMYGLTLAVRHWKGDTIDDAHIKTRSHEFTKSFYFWMHPYPKSAESKLKTYLSEAKSGEIFKRRGYGSYYAHAYKTMKKLGLVKVPPIKEPK